MHRWILLLLGVGALLLPAGLMALGQETQQSYELSWWTVDGGGETFSTGGGYFLGGTSGQPDAGVLTGGNYSLDGGFWMGGVTVGGTYSIHLPLVLRHTP